MAPRSSVAGFDVNLLPAADRKRFEAALIKIQKSLPDLELDVKLSTKQINVEIKRVNKTKLTPLKPPVQLLVTEVNKAIKAVNKKKLSAIKPPVQILVTEVNKAIKAVNKKQISALKPPVTILVTEVNAAIKKVNSNKTSALAVNAKFNRFQVQAALKAAATPEFFVFVDVVDGNYAKRIAQIKAEELARLQSIEMIKSAGNKQRLLDRESVNQRIKDNDVLDKEYLQGIRHRDRIEHALLDDRLKRERKASGGSNKPFLDNARQSISRVSGNLRGFEFAVQRALRVTAIAFTAWGVGVTAVVVGVVAASVVSFARLQVAARNAATIFAELEPSIRRSGDALAYVSAVGKITNKTIDSVRKISFTTTQSATELGEGMFFLASAGIRAEGALAAMGQISKFAQAGLFDVTEASQLLLQSMRAAGLEFDKRGRNIVRVTDLLTEANLRSTTTIEDLSKALANRSAAAFRLAGQDISTTIGLLQEFGNVGVVGLKAGEQLAIAIREISKAASGAKDTDINKFSLAFKKMGIQVFDSQGKVRNFATVLDDLSLVLEKQSPKQRILTLKSLGITERSSAALRQLVVRAIALRKQGSSLTQEVAKTSKLSAGATKRIAAAQLDILSAQFSLFKNQAVALLQIFGAPVAKVLTKFFKQVSAGGKLFDSLQKRAGGFGEQIAKQVQGFLKTLRGDAGKRFFNDLLTGIKLTLVGVKSFFTEFARGFTGTDTSAQPFIVTLGQIAKAMGEFTAKIAPKLGLAFGKLAAFIRDNDKELGGLAKASLELFVVAKAIRVIILPIISLASTIASAASTLIGSEGLVAGLSRLGAKLARIGGPVGILVGAILALIPSFIKLGKESEHFRKISGFLIGVLISSQLPIKIILQLFDLLGDAIGSLTTGFENFFFLLDDGDNIFVAFGKSMALVLAELELSINEFSKDTALAFIKPFEKITGSDFLSKGIKETADKEDKRLRDIADKLKAAGVKVGESTGKGVKAGVTTSIKLIDGQQVKLERRFKTFFDVRDNILKRATTTGSTLSGKRREKIAEAGVFSGFDPQQTVDAVQQVIDATRRFKGISPVVKVTAQEVNDAFAKLNISTPRQKKNSAALGGFGDQKELNAGLERLRLFRISATNESIKLNSIGPKLNTALTSVGTGAATGGKNASSAFNGVSTTLKSVLDGVKGFFGGITSFFRTTAIEKRLAKITEEAKAVAKSLAKGLGNVRGLVREPFKLTVADIVNIISTIPTALSPRIGSIQKSLRLSGLSLALVLEQGFRSGFQSLGEFATSIPRRIRTAIGPAVEALVPTGRHLMRGLQTGLRTGFEDFIVPDLKRYTKRIVDLKGPVSHDATLLVPAGEAVMKGFQRGLRRGFGPVEGFLRDVGPSMEEFVPDNLFLKRSAEFLLNFNKGGIKDPYAAFADLIPESVSGSFTGELDPTLGFLHKTLSLADTTEMAQHLAKLYKLQVSSVFRPNSITSSGNRSDHGFGTAADISGSVSGTNKMAASVKPLFGDIFKQLIWHNKDLNRGFFVPGHEDHMHLAWLMGNGFGLNSGKKGSSPSAGGPFGSIFAQASKAFSIPAALLKAVTKAESGFNPNAGSSAGAKGLMQLLPGTFAAQHVGGNIFDPKQNIFAGSKYLKSQLNRFHTNSLALAAYNAGPGAVQRYHGIPPFKETQDYVKRVLGYYAQFGGFREHGGSTAGGKAYVTGERGRELFIPNRNGFVMNNDRTERLISALESGNTSGGMGGPAINVNVQTASRDPEMVGPLAAAHLRGALGGLLL